MQSINVYVWCIVFMCVHSPAFLAQSSNLESPNANLEPNSLVKAEKVALVIGNASYQQKGFELDNTESDASLIGGSLRAIGFDVEIGLIRTVTTIPISGTNATNPAKPSIPSIRFNALIIPITDSIVKTVCKPSSFITPVPNKLPTVSILTFA